MECVKFGTVKLVATPETPGYFGSVCVTFDASSGAEECAKAMHGRQGVVCLLCSVPLLLCLAYACSLSGVVSVIFL